MLTPEQILQIAQYLQSRLPEILPADRAEAIDRQLTDLIDRYNAGEDLAQEIFDLLDEQPELSPSLLPGTPQDLNYSKGVVPSPPPGNPAPVPASESVPFKGMKDPTPTPQDTSKQK